MGLPLQVRVTVTSSEIVMTCHPFVARSLLATLLLSQGLPAAALVPSCGIVEPVQLFREAHASADRFVVLLGRLQMEEDLEELDREHEPFLAPFQGHQLTPQGFTAPVSTPIEVRHFCDPEMLGICGWIYRGEETLLFARKGEDGRFTVTAGPCGRWAQQKVTAEEIAELTSCARGECPTAP